MITESELVEFEKLIADATPGPWGDWYGRLSVFAQYDVVKPFYDPLELSLSGGHPYPFPNKNKKNDFKFISASRDMAPRLVEKVKRLKQEKADHETQWDYGKRYSQALDQIEQLRTELADYKAAVEVMAGALRELQLGHEHAPSLKHTRAMGDNYGWCGYCSTTVDWGPGIAEQALESDAAKKVLK